MPYETRADLQDEKVLGAIHRPPYRVRCSHRTQEGAHEDGDTTHLRDIQSLPAGRNYIVAVADGARSHHSEQHPMRRLTASQCPCLAGRASFPGLVPRLKARGDAERRRLAILRTAQVR